MINHHQLLHEWKTKKEELIQKFNLNEDDRVLLDTLEGETNLVDFIRKLIKDYIEARGLQVGIKSSIDELSQRANRFARREDSLKMLIAYLCEEAGLSKNEFPEASVHTRNNPPKLVIKDQELVPLEFRKPGAPDLSKIRDALANGSIIEWAVMQDGGKAFIIRVK